MLLKYRVHLDDYHSTVTAEWKEISTCVAEIERERAAGYDVGDITVDGKPLFCTKCGHPVSQPTGAHPLTGLCITHEHQADYDYHSARGRYMGD